MQKAGRAKKELPGTCGSTAGAIHLEGDQTAAAKN